MQKLYSLEGYALKNVIGEGVYAVVFEGKENSTGENKVVKIVYKGSGGARGAAHARKEIAALSVLRGERGVPQLEKWLEDKEFFYLVFSCRIGKSLEVPNVLFGLPEILYVCRSVLETIGNNHRRGVYHLDVKPSNVVATREGTVLIDFGCSIVSEEGEIEAGALPFDGTPSYMAPEMVKKPVSQRVDLAGLDVWSFGCFLHHITTGRDAFTSESIYSLYPKILACEVDYSRVPEPVAGICRLIFVSDPKKRIKVSALISCIDSFRV